MTFRLRFLVVGLAAAVVLLNDPGRARASAPVAPSEAACREVPEAETHLAVLLSPADVLWVDELREGVKLPDGVTPSGDGARIVISARPFSTAGWLQELIACHRARDIAHGGPLASSKSPLDVRGTSIHVGWEPGYLIVDIIASDPAGAREVLSRARACCPQAQAHAAR
jgi:hypothetical protein